MKDTITLNRTEQERAIVWSAVLSGEVERREAAAQVGLSERQVRRMLAAYRSEGPAGVVHGNRGRSPVQTLAPEPRGRIGALASGRYAGGNDSHLSELLAREEGISVSRSTVRRLRVAAGLARPRTRRAPTRGSRRGIGAAGMWRFPPSLLTRRMRPTTPRRPALRPPCWCELARTSLSGHSIG